MRADEDAARRDFANSATHGTGEANQGGHLVAIDAYRIVNEVLGHDQVTR